MENMESEKKKTRVKLLDFDDEVSRFSGQKKKKYLDTQLIMTSFSSRSDKTEFLKVCLDKLKFSNEQKNLKLDKLKETINNLTVNCGLPTPDPVFDLEHQKNIENSISYWKRKTELEENNTKQLEHMKYLKSDAIVIFYSEEILRKQ